MVIDLLQELPSTGRARVLGIGGYPLTGKSQLAVEVGRRWPGISYVLPTESTILSRAERIVRSLDGSHYDAHEVERLTQLVTDLRDGSSISIDVYSWHIGRASHKEASPTLTGDDLLIVDGSVSTVDPMLTLCDLALALRPSDLQTWLQIAVDRDVNERAWDAAGATDQNRAKAETVEAQLLRFSPGQRRRVLTVDVGLTWQVTLAD